MEIQNPNNLSINITNIVRFLSIDNIKKICQIRKSNNETKLNILVHKRPDDCNIQLNCISCYKNK